MSMSSEIDCDQAVTGLPPVTSAVFLIAILVKREASGGNIRDASATPSGIKRLV
jgi:hypothetical protein